LTLTFKVPVNSKLNMSEKTKYILSEGEYFHVYNRGVNRGEIFFSERNYRYFVQRIETLLDPATVEIVSFCLMPNHFHFICFQKQQSGISGFMKDLCNGYGKAVNLERSRTGHLFEGKYKIKLIDSNEYLLHLT
jgi:putative transposase